MAPWIDDPAAFRAGMAVIHDAATLLDTIAPSHGASTPLELAPLRHVTRVSHQDKLHKELFSATTNVAP